MSPEDVEVEVELAAEEELMLMETEGVLVLAVVTRLEVVEVVEESPEETERPSRVPSTRQIGNKDRKRGVQSTCSQNNKDNMYLLKKCIFC